LIFTNIETLRVIRRVAIEAAHRQALAMRKVAAMARAIARGDGPPADRELLAKTLRQLAEHCEHEAGEHLEAIRFMTHDGETLDELSSMDFVVRH